MDDGFFRHPKWSNKDAGRREKYRDAGKENI